MKKHILLLALSSVLLAGCLGPESPSTLIGVMIDNHEDAREYQRGLEDAVLIQEQFVEGYITRLLAIFDADNFPESVGPIRSARPYFIDGSSPVLSAIFHVGGSPAALEQLEKNERPLSFNALHMDRFFDYDDDAPAPHDRFLSQESMKKLRSSFTDPSPLLQPLFPTGSFVSQEPASVVKINYSSSLHNVTFTYDSKTNSYSRTNGAVEEQASPSNVVILETDVEMVGPLGRLQVTTEGAGKALLFRNGGMQRGSWSKSGKESFYVISDAAGNPLSFEKGQVWMIVLDNLSRVQFLPNM